MPSRSNFRQAKVKELQDFRENSTYVLSLRNLIYNCRVGGEITPTSRAHLHKCFSETENWYKQLAVIQ